ncbi:hypothetical protein [Pyrobaculum sp.]|uniref:hypothetical protein n=1 Tax=Pyrobaculum sp. TaxID=2004705 RepID=UPI0031605B95
MEFPKLLVIRYFSETLGMKFVGEEGDVLWFEDGLNKVAVDVYLSEVYEETELYKRVAALAGLNAAKTYLAVLPDGSAFVDPRFFKNQGIGLVLVDPAGGVEIKIYAKARQAQVPVVDVNKVAEAVKAAVLESLKAEIKGLEAALLDKLKKYVDQRLEEFRRQAASQAPSQPERQTEAPALDNEWVRILRSRSR